MTKKKRQLPKIGKRTVKNDFEYKIYERLCGLTTKDRVEYESTKFNYSTEHTYLPDFSVRTKSGRLIFIETKGGGRAFDHAVRAKMIAVKAQHPELDLRIIFYSDGVFGAKRKDGSRQRQSDWAAKNNFKFAIREVPEDWFNE